MAKFELVSKYVGHEELLPKRGTTNSAGYDFIVAEDITIPSYFDKADSLNYWKDLQGGYKDPFEVFFTTKRPAENPSYPIYTLNEAKEEFKKNNFNPTLVPTGVKCKLNPDEYLSIVARSSTPLKYWLIVANAPGTVDSDYYNNADNEGHVFIQLINLSPFDIQLQKGDRIAQGIIQRYYTTEDDQATGRRVGGFGSTTK